MVASFTDAWIETRIYIRSKSKAFVASFTDAWIETFVLRRLPYMTASRIFYRCVDWNAFALVPAVMYGVASFTDAWIETFVLRRLPYMTAVASFTDAWIETFNPEFDHIGYQVASFTDAWIETGLTRIELLGGSRIFYRCVDWNIKILTGFYPITESHLLQMRGLKLAQQTLFRPLLFLVASFTDAWIETWFDSKAYRQGKSHLLQMRGLKPNRTSL